MKLYHIFSFDNIYPPFEDGIPTFCPILSAIGTLTYKLAKFCDKLLKSIPIK